MKVFNEANDAILECRSHIYHVAATIVGRHEVRRECGIINAIESPHIVSAYIATSNHFADANVSQARHMYQLPTVRKGRQHSA